MAGQINGVLMILVTGLLYAFRDDAKAYFVEVSRERERAKIRVDRLATELKAAHIRAKKARAVLFDFRAACFTRRLIPVIPGTLRRRMTATTMGTSATIPIFTPAEIAGRLTPPGSVSSLDMLDGPSVSRVDFEVDEDSASVHSAHSFGSLRSTASGGSKVSTREEDLDVALPIGGSTSTAKRRAQDPSYLLSRFSFEEAARAAQAPETGPTIASGSPSGHSGPESGSGSGSGSSGSDTHTLRSGERGSSAAMSGRLRPRRRTTEPATSRWSVTTRDSPLEATDTSTFETYDHSRRTSLLSESHFPDEGTSYQSGWF